MSKTIAYIRVSTIDQDLDKNKADILSLAKVKGFGQIQFVEEPILGKVAWRDRKIAEIIDSMNREDNLIIIEFSSLGRSVLECMEILSVIAAKGINIYTIKNNWNLDQR